MSDLNGAAEFYHAFDEMRAILRDAWQKGFVAGFSGNASIRLFEGQILMTAAGAAKGRLGPENVCLLDNNGRLLMGGKPSSEGKMHLALYARRPDCRAILHTHPPKLLALSLLLQERGLMPEKFLKLPLFEAEIALKSLACAQAASPGTQDLASGAAAAAQDPQIKCVWLTRHGLCSLAASLSDALAQTEELEHLAGIQLALAGCRQ